MGTLPLWYLLKFFAIRWLSCGGSTSTCESEIRSCCRISGGNVLEIGTPGFLNVDGGPENKGDVDFLCSQLGIPKHTITAYHPEIANGTVGRGHKQLVDALGKLTAGNEHKWPQFLNAVLWADRITTQNSTGFVGVAKVGFLKWRG